jgi:hypothetical protein
MVRKGKIMLICLLMALFVGPLCGTLGMYLTTPAIQSMDAGTIQSHYYVFYGENLTSLSNTIQTTEDISFDPQADITGVTLQNFSLTAGHIFQVEQKVPYVLEFAMNTVNLSGTLDIKGSPTIAADTVNITQTFESNSYGIGTTIGSPALALNNVNASVMRFRVSGGTLSWNHSKTGALTLNGFTNAIIQSSVISGALTVGGTGNVTLLDTSYGSLIETVDPVIMVAQSTFSVPYSFVFQSTAKVTIRWSAYDNIQGPAFTLQTNITISKDGQYQETIPNVVGTSLEIPIQTAAAYYELEISCKDKQGNLATETITIVTAPNLLWFILMIGIIAGTAVGVILVFYWRKQHQWQKTALLDIPG